MNRSLTRILTWIAAAAVSLQSGVAAATPLLVIPKVPFFIGQNVPPNILLTLDDSGSMAWAYVPDSFPSSSHIAFKSPLNAIYYNPDVEYPAPVDANGVPFATSFTQAWINGFDPSRGWVDLSNNYRPTVSYNPASTGQSVGNHCDDWNGSNICPVSGIHRSNGTRAYYWRYNAGGACPTTPGLAPLPAKACFSFQPVPVAEEQNFANWYSFYRIRNLATVSAATLAFVDLPADYRVGWQALNTCTGGSDWFSTACRGWNGATPTVNARVEIFTQTKKQSLWQWMTRLPASGGTPLRQAFDRSGRYLQQTGSGGPYADSPGSSTTTYTSCRQSYSVVMTDGIWNGAGPASATGNVDNTATTTPDGRSYTPRRPFMDNNTSSLADIAFNYWRRDLQPGLNNNVKAFTPFSGGASVTDDEYWDPRNDPATWQHMTSFFVGLGLSSWLTNPSWQGSTFAGSTTAPLTGYPSILNGPTNWPNTGDNQPGNVADMWHGAVNSRGEFFSVETPAALIDAFRRIRNRIDNQSGAVASAAGTSVQVQTDSMLYSSTFNSNKWDGELRAYKVNADGTIQTTPTWSTENTMDWVGATKYASNNRVLVRSSGGGLIPFNTTNFTSLPVAQQTALNSQAAALGVPTADLVKWLLGDDSNTNLRRRDRVLGDLLNSAPVFEGGRDYGYIETMWTDSPRIDGKVYADYLKFKGEPGTPGYKPTVYVGSNDGMLHAFHGETGARRFSFIPTPALAKIGQRADPQYAHDYFVDGPIALHDVWNGSAWRTILVASTGAGARGLFALDVTNPDGPLLLWEYFPNDDDLGYVTGEPVIARADNGSWVVVFGSGVGSESNKAAVYVLNALTGSLMKKIVAGPAVTTSPNGMAAPALLYLAGKKLAFGYAGDLQGNLWRFDFKGPPASWNVDFGGSPIFRATGPTGARQPITAKPRIASDRVLGRVIVVGTGKLIEVGDKNDNSVQTLYGVFDRATGGTATRSAFTEQTIVTQTSGDRTTSKNPLGSGSAGWFIDYKGNATTLGERIVSPVTYAPELSLILASSVRVSGDACDASMQSWVLALSPFSGAAVTVFSALGGGKSSGYLLDGSMAVPTVMRRGDKFMLYSQRGGSPIPPVEGTKRWNSRAAWRQLR